MLSAKSPVRRNKSTRSHPSNLGSLREFSFALGFVRALLLIFVERCIDPRHWILLFLCKQLVHAFRRAEGAASVQPVGGRISFVEYVVDTAVDEGVLWLKLVVVLHAVFTWRGL